MSPMRSDESRLSKTESKCAHGRLCHTGVLLARGEIITILMDNSWVPADFVERTLAFYANPARAKSFLAYPERFFRYAGAGGGGRPTHLKVKPQLVYFDNTQKPMIVRIHHVYTVVKA